ncbi:TonB-dependent receptor [Algoriphagus hitonicola]|uniref:Outer membrane receptor proteins, mostly Fe transport n=1 Tax=Algoriphagus hitonicola TaxID=435880 RepID=A0A1I2VLA1_9BACT|nr:TonB-dependent receptor [Algoriphagus hitonicola]SFG89910.1 Outer membrane receptor proteins, mostly Fe transport [Algoriphagus hitonicola]
MKPILLLVILYSLFLPGMAQSNSGIEGTVIDESGAPLPGALVQIRELNKSAITNPNGQFFFEQIQRGSYILEVSFIGYQRFETSVELSESPNLELEIKLIPDAIQLEGLVVTSQRRSQLIKDVPIAVTSYGTDFLTRTNTFEFDALSEFVPGLQVQLQSVNNPGFVIRGITSDDGDARVEPRVSVFQDGVSISKSRGSVVELFDMERVEVLKGPQGTLFGRGAQIGAIHLIQNKAKNSFSSQIRLGAGDYGQRLATGHVNVPLTDQFFLRVAGIYNAREGYLENLSGGTLNGKDTKAGRIAMKYLSGKNTAIDFIFNYQKDTPPGTAFKSGTYAPFGGDVSPNTFADMERGNELGVDRSVWGATLLVNQTLGSTWDLSSITAYREFDSFETFDSDGTVAPTLFLGEEAIGKQFSQELRFNFADESRFRGFTGLSFFYENGSQRIPYEGDERSLYALFTPFVRSGIQGASLPDPVKEQVLAAIPFEPLVINGQANLVNNLPNVPAIFGPLAGAPLKSVHREVSTNFGRNYAYEVFADGTYDFNSKLSVTAGLRGTYEQITGALDVPEAEERGTLGFILTGGSANNIFTPTDGRKETTEEFFSAVGRLAVDYKMSPNTTFFGNVSRGRRPNVVQVLASETNVLNAETVWSYEVGMKTLSSDDRLSFDLNAYYYDYSNFQTSIAVADQDGLRIDTRDEGASTALGFETALRYAVVKNLSFFANYGFIDATFDEVDAEGNAQNLAGNTFRLTPKHSASAGLDFGIPISQKALLYFRPTYSYKSRVFFEETNLPGIEQEGYGMLNLRLGFNFGQKYDLMLFANNALDEEFIIDAGNTGGAFGIPTFIAGPPRMIGAQFTVNFR